MLTGSLPSAMWPALSRRDWDRFIHARRRGRIGPSGKPVSDRTAEYDVKSPIAVLNWAAKFRDERGSAVARLEPAEGLEDTHGE